MFLRLPPDLPHADAEQSEASDIAPVYQSSLLRDRGIPHAFGTRHATPEQVVAAAGLDPSSLRRVRQVHGCGCLASDDAALSNTTFNTWPAADAIVSHEPGTPIGIVTADCVPILMSTEDGVIVAAVHAGWRGLVAGVIEQTYHQLHADAAKRSDDASAVEVLAAIGPCLCQSCFEVGPDVADHFDPSYVSQNPGERPHVDLRAAAADRLDSLGLTEKHIDITDACTACDDAEFFSHRRDVTWRGSDTTGRMLSVIARAGSAG